MKLNPDKEINCKSNTKAYNETPQRQNGSKKSNIICRSEYGISQKSQLCALCSKWTAQTTADLNNKEFMKVLSKVNVLSDDIYMKESKAVCVNCVFKANTSAGVRGEWPETLSPELYILENKLSMQNKVKMSEEISKSEPYAAESPVKSQQLNDKNSLISVNSVSDQSKLTQKQNTKNDRLQKENTMKQQSCPNSSSSNDSNENNFALDIMFERREPPVDTESGGNINTYLRYYCQTCPMMFSNQTELNAHVRSHPVTRKSSSATPINGERRHRCSACASTFSDAKRLKEHKRIHLKRLYCHLCHNEQFNKLDHEFHVAECVGKKMAADNDSLRENNKTKRTLTRTLSKSMQSIEEPKIAESVSSFDDFDESSLAATSFNVEIKPSTISIEYPSEPSLAAKAYDCLLLDRMISAFSQKVFTCFVVNCNYITNVIRNMCRHEVLRHKLKARYFCRKCDGRFTRKVYLDYHLYLQSSGRFICIKCAKNFVYQYQLDNHFVQHGKMSGFKCSYCKNEYLTESELVEHYNETFHHHETGSREKIRIHNSLKIVNEVPMDPPPKRTYTIQDRVMELPQMPSKRPMHLPWHKPFRLFLGDLEFKDETTSNCVGSTK